MNQLISARLQSLRQATRRVVVRTVVGTTLVLATVEVTTQLPSQGRASWFYHYLADDVATPLLRKFLQPETAHNVAIRMAKAGLTPLHRFPSADEQRVSLQQRLVFYDNDQSSTIAAHISNTDNATDTGTSDTATTGSKRSRIKTLVVDNPICLAAGFDKDGDVIQPLLALGFGMVEIGTVTWRPQPGNTDRPRMFRLTADAAIINRYGFNSRGARAVLHNVLTYRQASSIRLQQQKEQQEALSRQPLWKQIVYTLYSQTMATIFTSTRIENSNTAETTAQGLLGINIGKNKSSMTNDETIRDYVACIETLGPVADYLVINVSSPNTPNLRDAWLNDVSNFQSLLQACLAARNQLATTTNNTSDADATLPPLFVKLSPDLPDESLRAIVNVCLGNGYSSNDDSDDDDDSSSSPSSPSPRPLVDGIVVTNTTTARPADLLSWQHRNEHGGLSGEPLKDVSTTCIRKVYAWTHGAIPIIGVGGISSGRDAYEKLCAGASLVQVYSCMIYHGPGVVSRIRAELATIMRNNGHRCLADVVGTDHPDIVYSNRFVSSSSSSPLPSSVSSFREGNVTPSSSSSPSVASTRAIATSTEDEGGEVKETFTVSDEEHDGDSRFLEHETMSTFLKDGAIQPNHGALDDDDDDDDAKKT